MQSPRQTHPEIEESQPRTRGPAAQHPRHPVRDSTINQPHWPRPGSRPLHQRDSGRIWLGLSRRCPTAGPPRATRQPANGGRDNHNRLLTKTRPKRGPPRHPPRPRCQLELRTAKPIITSHTPAQKTPQKKAAENLRINHRSPLRPAQTTSQRQPTDSPSTGCQKRRNDVRHTSQKKHAPLTRLSMTHTGNLDVRFDLRE